MKTNNKIIKTITIIMLVLMNISIILMFLGEILPIDFGALVILFVISFIYLVADLLHSLLICKKTK
ncbi:MAG: hypothetical protein E7270_00115 [Lachnospiraceae bacterium]|nr:hypothetical protein [Lachnospiraceae bacterium]